MAIGRWTTQDELRFINSLIAQGKVSALRGLQSAYKLRRWDQPGMEVDRNKVNYYLNKYLERLIPSPRPARHWALRSNDEE